MPTRLGIPDTRCVRRLSLLKQPARRLATAQIQADGHRPWSYPPASVSIDNDQVARLASKPLHHLTLADLVQYFIHWLQTTHRWLIPERQARPPTSLRRHPLLFCQLQPLLDPCPPCAPNPSIPQSTFHSRIQSTDLPYLQHLCPFPIHPLALSRAQHHQP